MEMVLVVDDDPMMLGTIGRGLTYEGYKVILTTAATRALNYLEALQFDLLILDVVLPGMDGLELCRLLRARPEPEYSSLPILFISGRGETSNMVAGLEAGGDDYLAKPFELIELNARVRALLRRKMVQPNTSSSRLEVAGLQLDSVTFRARTEKGVAQLTSTEYRLLEYLVSHSGKPHSADELLQTVWDYPPNTGDPDLVRSHISNIRRKLEPDVRNPRHLRTIHGLGYIVDR